MSQENKSIIFFDGVCELCNGFVDFVLKRDKEHQYLFSPLQGMAAKERGIELIGDSAKWSIRFVQGEEIFEKSTAALKIISGLGGGWSLFKAFLILPTPFRDGCYEWIAKNRYRWFGKKSHCRIPSPQERACFLP